MKKGELWLEHVNTGCWSWLSFLHPGRIEKNPPTQSLCQACIPPTPGRNPFIWALSECLQSRADLAHQSYCRATAPVMSPQRRTPNTAWQPLFPWSAAPELDLPPSLQPFWGCWQHGSSYPAAKAGRTLARGGQQLWACCWAVPPSVGICLGSSWAVLGHKAGTALLLWCTKSLRFSTANPTLYQS